MWNKQKLQKKGREYKREKINELVTKSKNSTDMYI
jgi:hypothetical protein